MIIDGIKMFNIFDIIQVVVEYQSAVMFWIVLKCANNIHTSFMINFTTFHQQNNNLLSVVQHTKGWSE